MGINLIYNFKQDGTIISSFPVQKAANNIQDLILDIDWNNLLENHEYRIIEPIKLSKKILESPNKNLNCRMELFPLESTTNDSAAFTCIIKCLDACEVTAKNDNIKNLRAILDLLPFGVAIIRRDKRVYMMNKAALELAGYSSFEEFEELDRPCQDTFCPAPKGKCPIWEMGQHFDKTERGFLMRDGTCIQVLKSAVQVNFEGETMMLEGIIDLRKQKDLELLAYSDALTGILNRKGLRDKFNYITEQLNSKLQEYRILMIDLDDFKQINDTYGHFAGDNVLRAFVKCAKKELNCGDIFCRWGGDEFLIITTVDIPECVKIVQRIVKRTKNINFDTEEWNKISLHFSTGIANIEQGMTLDQAVNKVDASMYRAKRDRIGVYYEEHCASNLD